MNEIHWMVALEKRAEMVQAIERAHLAEEMQGTEKPRIGTRAASFTMLASAAAVLVLLVITHAQ